MTKQKIHLLYENVDAYLDYALQEPKLFLLHNSENIREFIDCAKSEGYTKIITRQEVLKVVEKYKCSFPHWLIQDKRLRGRKRATYHLDKTVLLNTHLEKRCRE